MLNWLRGGNAVEHVVGAGVPGHIRIAFPSFGGAQGDHEMRSASQLTVSREEIAELLQNELAPVKN